jgi:hypothetical protein
VSELVKDIKNYLVSHSIALTGVIFLNSCPDTPDNIISITQYGGEGGLNLVKPRVQILVRNTDYATGKALITSIRTLLDSTSPEQFTTFSNNRIAIFSALQEPFPVFDDTRKRNKFICNFRILTVRDS